MKTTFALKKENFKNKKLKTSSSSSAVLPLPIMAEALLLRPSEGMKTEVGINNDVHHHHNTDKLSGKENSSAAVVKIVTEKEEVNVEEYIAIAKETHINVQDTRAKLYRLLDRTEKETKESRELKTRLDKLTKRLFEVKMALKRAGCNLKQIEFRPEPVNRL